MAVNSGASGLEFQDASSGKIGQVLQTVVQGDQSINPGANTWGGWSAISIDITPTATSSKVWVGFNGIGGFDNWAGLRIYKSVGGGSFSEISSAHGGQSSNRNGGLPFHGYHYNDPSQARNFNIWYLDSPNTTSQITYRIYSICHSSSPHYIGRSYNDADYTSVIRASTFINAWEILA